MSLRPRKEATTDVEVVRSNLAALRETWIAGENEQQQQQAPEAATAAAAAGAPNSEALESAPGFSDLSQTEQSAASLGVHPQSLRPISFINEGHFKALIKANALDANLARRIEAYKKVASDDAGK